MTAAEDESVGTAPLWRMLPKAVRNLPAAVRFRAENSLDGFERARALLDIDREMASFRAITAEEEAAAALIRSLQMRGYPGADKLDLRKHQHKAAVGFFLTTIRQTIVDQGPITLTLTLKADPPTLTVAMPMAQFSNNPEFENYLLTMSEPLGGLVSRPGVDQQNYFDDAVDKVAGGRKVDKLLETAVNARNRLLYAHDSGKPASQLTIKTIDLRERRSKICIILAIAVLQIDTPQGFALQCLQGFLKVIGRQQLEVYT